MAVSFSTFPQITDELLTKVRFLGSEYEFFYTVGDEEYPLSCTSLDGSSVIGQLVDERGLWTPDTHNLGIRRTLDCISCKNLFGVNGIACVDATIGVAILWTSAHSRQRNTIHVGELRNSLEPQHLEIEYLFEKAVFRGSVEFNTILYIKKASPNPTDDEKFLANKKGFMLGEIEDKFILQFDGSGSMFPIYEEIRPGEPLWRTQCQYEDVLYSMFNESIKIFLNKAHPAYQYIDKTSKKYNQYLLLEVMSSALTTIILQIKDDDVAWSDIEQGKDSIAGSLAEAISYFRNKLEWKMNDAQALSLSIREFLGKRM